MRYNYKVSHVSRVDLTHLSRQAYQAKVSPCMDTVIGDYQSRLPKGSIAVGEKR
jgi:hypothetical protein